MDERRPAAIEKRHPPQSTTECPSIPGCVSQGQTAEEAERHIQEAIQECLAVRAEKGMPLTVAVREVEVPV